MPGNEESTRRKKLLRDLRNQERQTTREGLPAGILELKGLFDFLDIKLSESDCDHTLRFTREYVRRNAMDEGLLVAWLEQQGGYCDCEALNNAEAVVADAMPSYDNIRDESGSVN